MLGGSGAPPDSTTSMAVINVTTDHGLRCVSQLYGEGWEGRAGEGGPRALTFHPITGHGEIMSNTDKPRNTNAHIVRKYGGEGQKKEPEVWEVVGSGSWNQGREAGRGIDIFHYKSFSTL